MKLEKSVEVVKATWLHATAGYGSVSNLKDPEGQKLLLGGNQPDNAISAHAPSTVVFEIPKGAVSFSSKCTLSDKALKQVKGGTVRFQLWGFKPGALSQSASIAHQLARSKLGISQDAKVRTVWTDQGNRIPSHGAQLFVVDP